MKYAGLFLAVIKGLVLIGIVVWLLFELREHFVYGRAILPWGIFSMLAVCALVVAFASGAKICGHQIKKLKKETENPAANSDGS